MSSVQHTSVSTPLIQLENISVRRDERDILRNIDFALQAKEIVTLIGPNGAGKSTLIKVLLGIMSPNKGKVHFSKKLKLAYVPQKFNPSASLPLRVQDLLDLEICTADLREEISRDTGIQKLLSSKVQQLSGGERQRVLLARALLRQPDILVLDEPMQGLDIQSEADFEKYKGTLNGKVIMLPTTLSTSPAFEPEARRLTEEDLANRKEVSVGGGGGRYTPAQLQQMRDQRALDQKVNDFLLEEGIALRISGTRGNFGTVFHTRAGSYSTAKNKTIPEMEIALEHFGRIERLLKNGQTVTVDAEIEVEWLDDDYKGYNVLAEIPGTDKTLKPELVLLGAHLDSWHAGTGANDNAAGVVVMMEAIRILKTLGVQPKRTIRIALWGEEEQGLFGSRGYVQKYVADRQTLDKKGEWDKISAYYNVDNGSGKIRGIYLEGNDQLVPIFEKWFEPFHEMGAKTITRRNTGSTDHVAFDAVGVPGFQFIQDPIDYGRGYHTNMDLYERMQQIDMTQAAIIVAAMVYNTAQRDQKLPRKPWDN